MIYINRDLRKVLIEHSKDEFPNEACGLLAGKDNRVERIYGMRNTDKSATSFFMDPQEQLKVMKEMRASGLDFIGVYHSHPETKAYPSAHDVELAFYPEVSYVIVSLKDGDNPDICSFKIVEGKITKEEVRVE
ncbi:MAG: M67 family metallopeptidase [Candidatus Omnitrophica bacterium]|nr:M67 family metallopeptidase [Candidatus Omnitrophota bacterium]MBU4590347.1 M67 family metallopeptidase [Candidatus Omnitrophota bacterium]